MAYNFNGTNQRLSTTTTPVTGTPLTIALWANIDNTTTSTKTLCSVGVSSALHRNQISLAGDGSGLNKLLVFSDGATTSNDSGGAERVSASTWAHCAGVFASTSSRIGYLNGVLDSNSTVNVGTQDSANSIVVGARWEFVLGNYTDGKIAEVGIWNAALAADEVVSLARGTPCNLIRPQNLVFYTPLVRNIQDLAQARSITNNNTATVFVHPRIYG